MKNLNHKQKIKAYEKAVKELGSLLKDESHQVLKMATINCVLKDNLTYYFWTGFYIVENGELIVGPYQGILGCLHIAFGKGVCGTAAKTKETQIVPDVHKFPGHIACDSRSKSEIVVPVFDKNKNLIAVFDVDSTEKNSFDEIDKTYLEKLLYTHFAAGKKSRLKPIKKYNLSEVDNKLGNIFWSPVDVCDINDWVLRAAAVKGDFHWHTHNDDEFFLIHKGTLRIDTEKGPIELKENEGTVIPKGIKHKPFAKDRTVVLLLEPKRLDTKGDK